MQWLTKSWVMAKFQGTEIRLHFSMLLTIVFAYYVFRPVDFRGILSAFLMLVGIIICVILHEMGHTLTAKLLGVEVKSIVIWPLGGFTNLAYKPQKPLHNFLISVSGPLVNVFIVFALGVPYLVLAFILPSNIADDCYLWADALLNMVGTLSILNLVLVIFNILPIYPLDGGEIMRSVLEMILGKPNADIITMIVSLPILLCLVGLGVYTRDYVLLFVCVMIFLAICTLNRNTRHWLNLALNYVFKRVGYYYLQGNYDAVVHYFTREIEREPAQANHYVGRATAYLSLVKKEMARADLERALKVEPDNTVALQLLGVLYALDKDYDTAVKYYDRALQLKPNWAIPIFHQGSIYLDRKVYEPALERLNKAILLMPQLPIFFLVRSMLHFRLGNLNLAHADQDQAIHLSPKEALVMVDANLQIYEEYLDWAEDYYGRLIAQKSNLPLAYQGRADAYRMNGTYEQAIADYARALEFSPREPRLYFGRGKAYQALGNPVQAGDDFRRARELTDKTHQRRQAEEYLKELG